MSGRLFDWLAVPVLIFVFAGLALYHYVRLDRRQADDAKLKELAQQKLPEVRSAANDWPQWRGPHRDGVSSETDLLTVWPDGGPKLLWEQKTGEGYSTVVVAKGRVFTMFQEQTNETVVCWDESTGKEHWRFSYPARYTNQYGDGPRSTPTVAGDFVYTIGGTGIMHCLDAFSDKPAKRDIWRKDLQAEFNAEVPKWGFACSPLVEEGRVFIQPGGPNGNSLAALDAKTGAIVWKKNDDIASFSSPMPATFHGQRHILFFTGERLISVLPGTGEKLWDYAWPIEFQCNIATPIVVNDYVFISSGYGRGCAMLKIENIGDTWQPALVYKNRKMRNHFSTCVRHQDHLFGFDDSNLKCMNLLTGEVRWTERGFDKGSVLLAGDQLIIHGENGIIALADAAPDRYREKSRFSFTTQRTACWSIPVVANGRLYVRDQHKLGCYDVKARP